MTNTLNPTLAALQTSLEAAYAAPPSDQLPLNSDTLTPAGAGIVDLFNQYLHQSEIILQGNAIQIEAADDGQSLLVYDCAAMTPYLGLSSPAVHITFGVSGEDLTIDMLSNAGTTWTLGDTYPLLNETYFNALAFSNTAEQAPRFLLSSLGTPAAGESPELPMGLNFIGYLILDTEPAEGFKTLIPNITNPLLTAGPTSVDTTLEVLDISAPVDGFRINLPILPPLNFSNPVATVYGEVMTTPNEIQYTQLGVHANVVVGGVSLPLAVGLPVPLYGRQLQLMPNQTVPLGNVASFLASFLGLDLAAALPAQVAALNCFQLVAFNVALSEDLSNFSSFSMSVNTAANLEAQSIWTIIDSVLTLTDLSFSFSVSKSNNGVYSTSGSLIGEVALGGNLRIRADVPLPFSVGTWTLSAYTTSPASLIDFAQLLGGQSLANMLPQGLDSLTSYMLEELTLVYNAGQKKLDATILGITSAEAWSIVPNQLEIHNVFLNCRINDPLGYRAALIGNVGGIILIGIVPVNVTIYKSEVQDPWYLKVFTENIPLPTIGDLANLAGQDIAYLLPESLQSFGFILSNLEILVNINQAQLDQLVFSLESVGSWDIVPGYLTLERAYVSMNLSRLDTNLTYEVQVGGNLGIVGKVFDLSATRERNGDWIFRGALSEGEFLSLGYMVGTLLGLDDPAYLPSLNVEGIVAQVSLLADGTTSYSFEGRTQGYWEYEVSNALRLRMAAAVSFELHGDGTTAGYIAGDFWINNLQIFSSYQFDETSTTLLFRISFRSFFISAALHSGTNSKGGKFNTVTFRLGDLSLGQILNYLVGLAAPGRNFSLSSPWDALNEINLKNLSMTVDLDRRKVTIAYEAKINLIFMEITALGFTYTEDAGKGSVKLALSGKLLDQTYSIADNNPLEWDVLNEPAPPVPGTGVQLIDLRYLGLGQHVAFSNTRNLNSVGQVIDAMRAQMQPVKDGNRNPLALNNGSQLRFNGASHFLIGTDFEIMKAVSLQLVFNDPYLYGLAVGLSGDKVGSLAGLRFELLYKRITDDIGVFKIELRVPDAFRQLDFGTFSVTLPVIKVDIYTNGNFRVDLGFPQNEDFNDSFCLQVFPFIGYGGMYLAYLNGATSERVPAITNGNFSPVIEFGLGLNVGLGKDVRKGPLSGGLSVTVIGIVEGSLAWFNPQNTSQKSELFYWLRGTIGVEGRLYGKVDFKVIKVEVSVSARATVTLVLEAYMASLVVARLKATAKASVKVLFVKKSFSYDVDLKETFTIGSNKRTPWIVDPHAPAIGSQREALVLSADGGALQPRLRMQGPPIRRRSLAALVRAGMAPELLAVHGLRLSRVETSQVTLSWTPVAVFPEIQTIAVTMLPALTVLDGIVQTVLSLSVENSIDPEATEIEEIRVHTMAHSARAESAEDAPFNLLLKGMLAWSIYTKTGTLDGDISRTELELLMAAMELPATDQDGFTYQNLSDFMALNYSVLLSGLPDDYATASDVSASPFPMVPNLSFTSTGELARDYGTYKPVSAAYEANLAAYYDQLNVNYDYYRSDNPFIDTQPPEGVTPGGDPSLATTIFRDYFLLLAKTGVQAALDILDNYVFELGDDDSLQSIAEQFPPQPGTYTVHEGDTVAGIAQAFDMTIVKLEELNGGDLHDPLTPGTSVNVEIAVTPTTIAEADNAAKLTAGNTFNLYDLAYQVKAGESLDSIKTQMGVPAGTNLTADPVNKMNRQLLADGQTIRIAQPGDSNDYSYFIYASVAGDDEDSIAVWAYVRNYGAYDSNLAAWYEQTIVNLNTDPDEPFTGPDLSGVIETGTSLVIPNAYNDPTPTAEPYVTRPGDTLALVAGYTLVLQNDSTLLDDIIQGLEDLNTVDWNDLPAGTVIKVPYQEHTIQGADTIQSLADLFLIAPTDLEGGPNGSSTTLLASLAVLQITHAVYTTVTDDTLGLIAANFNLGIDQLANQVAEVTGIFLNPPPTPIYVPQVPIYPISDLIEDTVNQEVANNAAGSVSRFMLDGLRVPDPEDTDFTEASPNALAGAAQTPHALFPLYTMTGQQFPYPTELPFTLTFTNNGASWLQFVDSEISQDGADGAELIRRSPQIAQRNPGLNFEAAIPAGMHLMTDDLDNLTITLTEAYLSEAPAAGFDPQILEGPIPLPLGVSRAVRFALQSYIHWQTFETLPFVGDAEEPITGEPSLWLFSNNLKNQIRSEAASPRAYSLHAMNDQLEPDAQPPELSRYDWATIIEVKLSQIPSASADGAYLPNSYALATIDEADRLLLLELWTYLEVAGAAETGTNIHLLYAPNNDSNNNQGLASQALNSDQTFLIKTNLSTLTNSGNQQIVMAADLELNSLYGATIAQPEAFLKILWEGSVTNSGGYTLHYADSQGNGLPNQVFADSETGVIQLVVLLARQSTTNADSRLLRPFNNCAVLGDNVDPGRENLYVTPAAPTQADQRIQATVPPGNVGFQLSRKNPSYEDPITDPAQHLTRELFSLLGWQVVDGARFEASNTALNASPQEPKTDAGGIKGVPDGEIWNYESIVPVYKLAKSHALPLCPPLPLPSEDPYAGIAHNGTAGFSFHFRDIYGNQTTSQNPISELNTPVGYTDDIVGFGQWPGIASSYAFLPNSGDPLLSLNLSLQTTNYTPASGDSHGFETAMYNISAHLERYKQVYYQIRQADVTMALATSLNQATESDPPYAYAIAKQPVINFVSAVDVFLNAALEQKPATLKATSNDTFQTIAAANAPTPEAEPAYLLLLGEANRMTPTDALFSGDLNIPLYVVFAHGQTMNEVVADQGIDVVTLAGNNAHVPLNPNVDTPAPARTSEATVEGGTLAKIAEEMVCGVAGLADANATTRGLLTLGKTLIVKEASVTVEIAGATALSESFEDLIPKFAEQNQFATVADIAVANQDLLNIFVSGKTLNVNDYITQEGDTFDSLQSAYPAFTISAFSTAAAATPNLFADGTALYLKPAGSLKPSKDTTLESIAKTAGLSLNQVTNANSQTALKLDADVVQPNLVTMTHAKAETVVPYNIKAGDSLNTIAGLFGETDALTLAERNRTLTYVFNPGQTISVGTATTTTKANDSMDSVLARLQGQNGSITFDQLITAIEDETTLWLNDALFVAKLPQSSEGTLESLGAAFNSGSTLIAKTNASLEGLLADGITVSLEGKSFKTGTNETFNTLAERFSAVLSHQVSVAEVALANAQTAGLIAAECPFLLPPNEITPATALSADSQSPTYPSTIFKVTVALQISRSIDLVTAPFDQRPEVSFNSAQIAPTASESADNEALSLQYFAAAFEQSFPGLKAATGRDDLLQNSNQVWAVNFGEDGISAVNINGSNPSFFALQPLSNQLINRKDVAVRAFDPETGTLVPEDEPPLLDYQSVDLEVWSGDFLQAFELLLTPEYAVPACMQNPAAFTTLVSAKKTLAEKISLGLVNVLETAGPDSKPNAARERLYQELLINLSNGYGTDTLIQYPASISSCFDQTEAPRLAGKLNANVYRSGNKDDFNTLAAFYDVSTLTIAETLGEVVRILNDQVSVGFKNETYPIQPEYTINNLMTVVGAEGYQDFVDNLSTPDGLFAPETVINLYEISTTIGSTSKRADNGTFETLMVYFETTLAIIVAANQERMGIFEEGAVISIPGYPVTTVTDTNNSLVLMTAALGMESPLQLARALETDADVMNQAFVAKIVKLVPEHNLSSAKTSLRDGDGTLNVLFNVRAEARQKKQFLDLSYQINELEYDIETLPGTGGYQASSWLSFIIPLGSPQDRSNVINTLLGQVEIPIPLRAYPGAPTLVNQTGVAGVATPQSVNDAKKWDYGFSYSHQDAAQDSIYLSAAFNLKPEAKTAQAKIAQPDLFSALAQFNAVAGDIQAKLNELLTVTGENSVLAQTVATFADMAEQVALNWTYGGALQKAQAKTLNAGQTYNYRANFTVKENPNAPGEFISDTYILTLLPDTGGKLPDQPSPNGSFPQVSWRDSEGTWYELLKESETDSLCVYQYQQDVPAFEKLSHAVVYPGMDVTVIQNGLGGAMVTRNQSLISAGPTNAALIYATPLTMFTDRLTPLVTHDNLIIFNEEGEDLTQALTNLFDELLGPDATDFNIKVSVQYGYELVAASGQGDAPIVSLLPVAFRPVAAYTTSLPSDLASFLESWQSSKPFTSGQGIYVLDVTVYASLETNAQVPILNLEELGYVNS